MGNDPLKSGLMVTALVTVLDQLCKWAMLEIVMEPPRIIPVTSFFNLVLVWNRGVSFGFLGGASSQWIPWLLTVLALAIIATLGWWLRRAANRLMVLALGLVMGGALGNVIDRLRFGAVMDFLDFHAAGLHWPAFNVADSAITVGATLILYDAFFVRRNP
ncbi:MAG: signal peptidase II [Alphaproteobacteria bacterium]|nr:signal peptidase II [Alphaproteobacteria bacterium]